MGNTSYQRVGDTTVNMRSTGQTITEAVAAGVAEYKGIDTFELDPPLYEAIDPEALSVLFRESQGSVRFDHWGCTITVDHDGVVTVTNGEDSR